MFKKLFITRLTPWYLRIKRQSTLELSVIPQDIISLKLKEVSGDAIAPSLLTAILIDSLTMELTFDEDLANIVPDGIDFVIDLSGGETNISNVLLEERVVTLNLDRQVAYGETGNIAYFPGVNKLQDAVGNQVESFDNAIINNVAPIAPEVMGIEVQNATPTIVRVTFDRDLDDNYDDVIAAISITGKTPSLISILNNILFVTTEAWEYGQSGMFTYIKPASNGLRSTQGALVESFSSEITNNVLPLAPDVPTGFGVTWINDFARISCNAIPADVQIELWSSRNGAAYILDSTWALGIYTEDNYTWQNESMAWKIRAVKDGHYSDFCNPISLSTPLILTVTPSTNPQTVTLSNYAQQAGTVTWDWGDGTIDEYIIGGNKTHQYFNTNLNYIKVYNANLITYLYTNFGSSGTRGNASKWKLPTGLTSNFRVEQLTGIIDNWMAPAGLVNMNIESGTGHLAGDMSNFLFPVSMSTFFARSCDLTNLPRGEFKNLSGVNGFQCQNNNVLTVTLDAWLHDRALYYAGNPPNNNLTFRLDGTGMGAPTGGQNNPDIVLIKQYFANVAKTATFTINS
jgi:hypothetical protein